MAEGFLGRWSQRKQDVREGKALEEPVPVQPAGPIPVASEGAAAEATATPVTALDADAAVPAAATEPVLTLDDVQNLTPQSDFKPFIARSVDPEVRNAAMKKLFADPHYNVMDRLDIYIDDYSKPDPLPESMLRQMASAQFLKLFDEVDGAQAEPAQAASPPITTEDHANTDLRLQQDDAAGPQGTGHGAG
jgi:hypothetical protein